MIFAIGFERVGRFQREEEMVRGILSHYRLRIETKPVTGELDGIGGLRPTI